MTSFKSLGFVLLLAVASVSARASPSSRYAEEGDRLIQISETEPAKWLSQEELAVLIANKVHFMDVTGRTYPKITRDPAAPSAFPASIRFQSTVRPTFASINLEWMTEFVREFSAFRNRYYNNQNGVDSSEWLFRQVEAVIESSNYRGNVSVNYWEHSAWPQNSVVARIQGSENGVVILGAHQDSINSGSPVNGVAPGADDNASGCVALLETLWIILESGIVPKNSIEFQFYAAEEVGLRGSQDIAETYQANGVNVIAAMNYDGYYTGIDKVSFLTDYVDRTLNTFVQLIVDEYLTFTWTEDYCGYACSDHASWYRFGFPVTGPSEATLFPSMHTVRDVLSVVNFEQVREFVKMAIAFCVELAEPQL